LTWRHFGVTLWRMATIQIKHVPEDVHAVFRSRAASAGQSLQEYLLNKLSEDARKPTLKELFKRIDENDGGVVSPDRASGLIRQDRDKS
jgi:hypothetical protein